VFDPLGMKATTFDYARALKASSARPHGPTVDGKPAVASMDMNYSIIPARPAGAGWSSVNDMLKYVQMELAEGALPDGKRYIGKDVLFERRNPQVSIGKDTTYGMGLTVNTTYGTQVVHHGGDMIGFHSDMMWLPEHNIGAVILTNADPGWVLRNQFQRKLLEVLFDGKPEADAAVANAGKVWFDQIATERKLLVVPADPAEAAKLAPKYKNAALGEIAVKKGPGGAVVFDVGEWRSEVASKKHPDGSVSFVTIAPGYGGFEFVVGAGDKPKLVIRDAQHEYVFESQ
jgi:CubicO group peptidase (beta-lactamase class C family)